MERAVAPAPCPEQGLEKGREGSDPCRVQNRFSKRGREGSDPCRVQNRFRKGTRG